MTDRPTVSGDADLATGFMADRRRARLVSRTSPLAVGIVRQGQVRTAVWNAGLDADFEIGSISKGVTGLLYCDAVDRGDVEPHRTLGDSLDLGDCPAARLTLASVSTHHSGLPRLPSTGDALRRTWQMWRDGRNPYGESLTELLAQTRSVRLGTPRFGYSNLGYELLGHAVASAADLSYAELVHQRIATPLGLGLYVAASPHDLGPGALVGRSRRGRPQDAWTGEALGPAGGIRGTIGDLSRLAQALLEGRAPGLAALEPVVSLGGRGASIGAAWIVLSLRRRGSPDRTVTWHNGGTGGFRTWLGLDRDRQTAVVVLHARAISPDRAALGFLESLTTERT